MHSFTALGYESPGNTPVTCLSFHYVCPYHMCVSRRLKAAEKVEPHTGSKEINPREVNSAQ